MNGCYGAKPEAADLEQSFRSAPQSGHTTQLLYTPPMPPSARWSILSAGHRTQDTPARGTRGRMFFCMAP